MSGALPAELDSGIFWISTEAIANKTTASLVTDTELPAPVVLS